MATLKAYCKPWLSDCAQQRCPGVNVSSEWSGPAWLLLRAGTEPGWFQCAAEREDIVGTGQLSAWAFQKQNGKWMSHGSLLHHLQAEALPSSFAKATILFLCKNKHWPGSRSLINTENECEQMQVCIYTHLHAHIRVCIHTYVHAYACVHTHRFRIPSQYTLLLSPAPISRSTPGLRRPGLGRSTSLPISIPPSFLFVRFKVKGLDWRGFPI